MLRGVVMPGIGTSGLELQWQTEALGWGQIDDLLVKCKGQDSNLRRLAISCKSNMQVSGSGLPSEFVNSAWKLWQKEGLFRKENDCMMLVQRGSNQKFFPVWADIKNWCAGGSAKSSIAKINAFQKHTKIYESVKNPKGKNKNFSNEDTINLIRHLEITHLDFQLASSETTTSSLAYCRDLLQDASEETAEKLWKWLLNKAKEKRLAGGTMQLWELWQELGLNFILKDHPNFASSWDAIEKITQDNKSLIETALPTGFSIERKEFEENLIDRLKKDSICVIYGGSGTGKSAFVKSVLDKTFLDWKQVWFSSEDLDLVLAEKTRQSLGLLHPLHEIFPSTTRNKNILVIDAAERIKSDCEKRAKQLIAHLLLSNNEEKRLPEWRVIVIGQTEAWANGKIQELTGAIPLKPIEVSALLPKDVRQALQSSPQLSWLVTHSDALIALGNLKALAWVMQAEIAFPKDGINDLSIPAIADRLWAYWTDDKVKLQSLLMKLAEREALFERSFAISELGLDASEALDDSPTQFPLRRNKTTNRYEFEHDLAADWARFQRLKEIKNDISSWAPFASNPLWHNALRMLGQLLLREKTGESASWDLAFEKAEKSKDAKPLAADILLDALCLDPFAEQYLNERSDMLLSDSGVRLNRLLKRFHYIATVPSVPDEIFKIDPSLNLYFEDYHRVPIYGRWPPIAGFLASHNKKVASLISPVVAKICETWLTTTPLYLDRDSPKPMPYRKEFAELAIATARTLQLEQRKGHIWFHDESEKPIYAAAFAAVNDLPDEVSAWALEMAQRKPCRQDIVEAVEAFREQQRREVAERLRSDKAYHERRKQLRSMSSPILGYREMPPWPLGPQGRVEQDFRQYCLQPHALARLMVKGPQVASELLLAMIIADSPKEEYSRSPRLDDQLGLAYDHSGYPTAYWKSPFFTFLQLSSTVALDTLLRLINFCMDRWEENYEHVSDLKIATKCGKQLSYKGDGRVFAWSQENSSSAGQLHCALDALERWLCMEIDKGVDIKPAVDTLLERTNSPAILGVLINIGKYKPELFKNSLQPLLGVYQLYMVDDNRVKSAKTWFEAWAWSGQGEKIFEIAREWAFAPHRQITLLGVAVQLIYEHDETANFLRSATQKWNLPPDRKYALEIRSLMAQLNRYKYKLVKDQKSGRVFLQCHYPDDLQRDIEAFQEDNNPSLQTLTLPFQCEKILQAPGILDDAEAEALSVALNVVPIQEDQESIRTAQAAIASTLSVKAPAWLDKKPDISGQVEGIIASVIADFEDPSKSSRSHFPLISDRSLKFVSYAIAHKWVENEGGKGDSEVLKILTSHDDQAVNVLMNIAYRNQDRLGHRWWRLLKISIFWAGLYQLKPDFREKDAVEHRWARWLRYLRGLKLNVPSTLESLNLLSIAKRIERLKNIRVQRLHGSDAENHSWYYRRGFSGLSTYTLKQAFSWLLNGNDQPANNNRDERLLTQKLWEFEVWRKKKSGGDDDKKDALPSDLGYALLQKLSKLLLAVPHSEAESLWKPVLTLGVDGHREIEHFIDGWFLEVMRLQNIKALSQLWRDMIEFALSSPNWSPQRYWYKGEQMFRHLLGFNSGLGECEKVQPVILQIKDLYKQWADKHLSIEEDNVAAFSRFLSSKAGAPIRLEGLLWIKEALSPPDALYWHRDETGSSLIQLLDVIVSQDTPKISSDSSIREALLSVGAHLASKQVPVALALQGRILLIR